MGTSPGIAYLTDGKLYCALPGRQPEPIESQFVRQAEERRAQQRERNAFRAKGMMWNVTQSAGMAGMGRGDFEMGDDGEVPVRFTSVAPGAKPNELYYSLQTDAIGGLFLLDVAENYERRLLHRQQLHLADLARCPVTGDLACSLATGTGAAHIGLMNSEGGSLREITSGDSADEAPCWAPNRERTLVFQSAGVGRHETGAIFGLSPYAICQLDLTKESLTTLVESPQHDYLAPRVGADGSLYCIRRPYQLRPSASPLKVAGDVLLFPFRFARAFVHFLNAFSMMFSRKPLITAGGVRREGPDKRAMLLWGRWVEVDRKLKYAKPESDPPLVPDTWHLVRRGTDGGEETLATGVVAYSLCGDGGFVYTNGSAIYHVERPGETAKRIARGRFVERVAVLG